MLSNCIHYLQKYITQWNCNVVMAVFLSFVEINIPVCPYYSWPITRFLTIVILRVPLEEQKQLAFT